MHTLRRFISLKTPKFHFIEKATSGRPFRILDVGSGNHSPSKIKSLFPEAEYHGIDLDTSYNYDEADKKAMDAFYGMDLTKLQFAQIPDNYFDVITMAHIIEHLHNGDMVIEGLSRKLKNGGCIYLEYPGRKSTRLPSTYGSLNFYDDKTHVRVFSVPELEKLLRGIHFRILASGTRRSIFYIAAMPFRIVSSWLRRRKPNVNVFWDLLGFAEFVYAQKS